MLSERPDLLYPLSSFLTMPRPQSFAAMGGGREGRARGEAVARAARWRSWSRLVGVAAGEEAASGSGWSGRNGWPRRSEPSRRWMAAAAGPVAAVRIKQRARVAEVRRSSSAEAGALGRYLVARGGYELVGDVIDTQMSGAGLEGVFMKRTR